MFHELVLDNFKYSIIMIQSIDNHMVYNTVTPIKYYP